MHILQHLQAKWKAGQALSCRSSGQLLLERSTQTLRPWAPLPPGIDIRRAARIINSYMSDDRAGIDTEMHAAATENRVTETLQQIMDTLEAALPELNSDAGLEWLQAHVDVLLAHEHDIDGQS